MSLIYQISKYNKCGDILQIYQIMLIFDEIKRGKYNLFIDVNESLSCCQTKVLACMLEQQSCNRENKTGWL